MKIYSRLLLLSALTLMSACGQKGPLILQEPSKASTQASENKQVDIEREVSQDEPVLDIQTDDTSSNR